MPNDATIAFLALHRNDDPMRLLLQQNKYPEVDMAWVAQQIEGKKQASAKWPMLASFESVWFPPRLNREQSSSEATAEYKATCFAPKDGRIADLTGGMGVDTMFFARKCAHVDYLEQDGRLCELMEHNAEEMRLTNLSCHQTDSMVWIEGQQQTFDLLYIDPARRNEQGMRVAAFEDCQPNLLDHLEMLLSHTEHLLVKASPMIDLSLALSQLRKVEQVHIVAVKGECKEILFYLTAQATHTEVHCVNLETSQPSFVFFWEDRTKTVQTALELGHYLYDPNAAIRKSGGVALLAEEYALAQLSHNTMLFTSDRFESDFPGRVFEIVTLVQLNAKSVKKAIPTGEAHVVSRNYPLAADKLQSQLKIREGGDFFLFATTFAMRHLGLLCRRLS